MRNQTTRHPKANSCLCDNLTLNVPIPDKVKKFHSFDNTNSMYIGKSMFTS